MTPEQKKFLQARLREAAKGQPEIKRLKSLLLRVGGDFLVAPPKPDANVVELVTSGFVMSGPVTLKAMKSSMCHQNAAAIWRDRKFGVVGIATGYALSDDGLWRQHTWGIQRTGILETTVERVKYFGILLQGARADHFAECNPY
jgi:hypothetical protein